MTQSAFQPTSEQQTIIAHEGSAFVMACPGAGKTRVMTERARHLFASMPAGRGVAFLSFTQAAISELEARMCEEGILSYPVFPSFIGTFDSFVWQILIAPFGVKGCDVRPRLIADLADLSVTPFVGAHPLPLSCFCKVTGEILPQESKVFGFDLHSKRPDQLRSYVAAAHKIRKKLRECGQLSFDDARDVALERLADMDIAPRIGAALVGRFHEVIVDEAQDCNPDDLKIISWLRDSGLPVKIVCDPHQSIYGFRGGVTSQLMEFAQTFGENERKCMTGNFRSTPNICRSTAQLRSMRTVPDQPLGRYKDDNTPILILSYAGNSVPATIGPAFGDYVKEGGFDTALCPIIAATKSSGAAAVGLPNGIKRRDRVIRLAMATTDFHFANGFTDMKSAICRVHQIVLELEDRLGELSYQQYLAANEIEPASWRPQILFLLQKLRFDPLIYADAKAWHAAAKNLFDKELTIGGVSSISQKLKWNKDVSIALVPVSKSIAVPCTIHSVKGMEFPAVCVVTTASTIKGVLDFLETGNSADKAEEARKLYVAASRAQKLLVIAAPKSQATRLAKLLRGQGAELDMKSV